MLHLLAQTSGGVQPGPGWWPALVSALVSGLAAICAVIWNNWNLNRHVLLKLQADKDAAHRARRDDARRAVYLDATASVAAAMGGLQSACDMRVSNEEISRAMDVHASKWLAAYLVADELLVRVLAEFSDNHRASLRKLLAARSVLIELLSTLHTYEKLQTQTVAELTSLYPSLNAENEESVKRRIDELRGDLRERTTLQTEAFSRYKQAETAYIDMATGEQNRLMEIVARMGEAAKAELGIDCQLGMLRRVLSESSARLKTLSEQPTTEISAGPPPDERRGTPISSGARTHAD